MAAAHEALHGHSLNPCHVTEENWKKKATIDNITTVIVYRGITIIEGYLVEWGDNSESFESNLFTYSWNMIW